MLFKINNINIVIGVTILLTIMNIIVMFIMPTMLSDDVAKGYIWKLEYANITIFIPPLGGEEKMQFYKYTFIYLLIDLALVVFNLFYVDRSKVILGCLMLNIICNPLTRLILYFTISVVIFFITGL